MLMPARAAGILLVLATVAQAQRPGDAPGPGDRPSFGMLAGMPGRDGASPIGATADFLLAHTGDLALTDAQVVRLAAISRRTDARRKTTMARMDSARAAARPAPGDSAGPRGRGPGFPMPTSAQMQQARDQMHADIRDAIAVLTPDQQANAWLMVAGGPALGAGRGMPMGAPPGRGRADDGQRSERGPISRPPAPRDVPRRPEGAERTEP